MYQPLLPVTSGHEMPAVLSVVFLHSVRSGAFVAVLMSLYLG